MNSQLHLLLLFAAATLLLLSTTPSVATSIAYPSIYGEESCGFSGAAACVAPERRETYGNGRIIDITHRIHPNMPAFGSSDGIGQFIWLVHSMKNGSIANNSEMKIGSHTGTHVDAPSHFYDNYLDAGFNIDSLDLDVLNGPALLVDVPRDSNITGFCSQSSDSLLGENISSCIHSLIDKLLKPGSDDVFDSFSRGLMFKKEFDSSYVGFMEDGAQWLKDHTDIKFVGIDYLSAAAYVHSAPSHLVFLESREIILVEALKLDNIPAGMYNVHCLSPRLSIAEGALIRCILIK